MPGARATCSADSRKILRGRNPVDANQITQRICGVCPVSHGLASSKCLDDAFNIRPNKNGRIMRNLVLSANYLQSHVIHFYHLCALDYVDITSILEYNGGDDKLVSVREWVKQEVKLKTGRPDAVTAAAPFLPRYEGNNFYIKDKDLNWAAIAHYLQAFDIRMKAHKMVASFGGRAPHLIGLVPGGVTQVPTRAVIREFKKNLREVEKFVNDIYINDVIAVARGYSDYFGYGKFMNQLSFGVFEEDDTLNTFTLQRGAYLNGAVEQLNTALIKEQVRYSRYSSGFKSPSAQGRYRAEPQQGRRLHMVEGPEVQGPAHGSGPPRTRCRRATSRGTTR